MAQIAIQLAITGAAIGLQYLLAKKKKVEPTDKGKFDDIRITGSDYGAFIPRIWGTVRLAPNIVFSNGIQHYVVETGGGRGGKGGGGAGGGGSAPVREHIYKTTVALLVCRGPVAAIPKMWADATTLFDYSQTIGNSLEAESALLANGAIVVEDETASNGFYVNLANAGSFVRFNSAAMFANAEPDSPNPDDEPSDPEFYTRLTVGYKSAVDTNVIITADGVAKTIIFPNSGNQFSTIQATLDGNPGVIEISNAAGLDVDYINLFYYVVDLAASAVERSSQTYRTGIIAPNTNYPKNRTDPSAFYAHTPRKDIRTGAINVSVPGEQIRIYTGTETQGIDPAIVAGLDAQFGPGNGAAHASAMRGLVYVVLENHTIPNGRLENFTMEVRQGTTSVAQIAKDLFADCGVESSELELSALSGKKLQGLIVNALTPPAQTLAQLEQWFGFRFVEIDGKIRAALDNSAIVATLNPLNLRAHDESGSMPDFDCEITRREEHQSPRVVNVKHLDPSLDYHTNSQSSTLFASTTAMETKEYSFPFISNPTIAREVAERLLLQEHSERTTFEFSALPENMRLAPQDCINLNLKNISQKVRIVRKQMDLPGVVKLNAVAVNDTDFQGAAVQTANVVNAFNSLLSDKPTFPRNSKLVVIDSTSIREKDGLGVYYGIVGNGFGDWYGASVVRVRGIDNEIEEMIDVVSTQSTIGIAQNALGDWADISQIDTVNTLLIHFYNAAELESVSAADISGDSQVNLIRVGNEWLQYQTAVAEILPIDSTFRSAWRISNFLRGRFSTKGIAHVSNENATLANKSLRFLPLEVSDIGKQIKLSVYTNGQSSDLADEVSFTFSGSSTPMQPRILSSVKMPLGNATITDLFTVPINRTLAPVMILISSPNADLSALVGSFKAVETQSSLILFNKTFAAMNLSQTRSTYYLTLNDDEPNAANRLTVSANSKITIEHSKFKVDGTDVGKFVEVTLIGVLF